MQAVYTSGECESKGNDVRKIQITARRVSDKTVIITVQDGQGSSSTSITCGHAQQVADAINDAFESLQTPGIGRAN